MDSFTPTDYAPGSPPEDPFGLSAILNFDGYSDLYADQVLSSYGFSPGNWAPLPSPSPQNATGFQFGSSPGRNRTGDYDSGEGGNSIIAPAVPKSLRVASLAERMLRALSLFKVTPDSASGFLAQVWMPVKQGDEYVLSTSEQPYLLDQMLAGYREVSRAFTFSPKEEPGSFPGLPGRVFMSGIPEWTSNVVYYNPSEYLRVEHAVSHDVRGSLAVPVFDPLGHRCCAVLELVTTKEKLNFDPEIENVCNALQAVGLQSAGIRTHQQNLTTNQKSALTGILDVLRAVCHAHMLPLALTWIPVFCGGESMEEILDANSSEKKKRMLCVQETACYVNDIRMQGFLHACAEHNLEKGQGPAGKALQSNQAYFSADVKGYDIREYPLVHHARKYDLHAAVAIRLRSTYTGDDDYVLEFFLPVNCRGGTEQQLLLDNLSSTMQRISRSLRRVLDSEVVDADVAKVEGHKGERTSPPSTDVSFKHYHGTDRVGHSQRTEQDAELPDKVPFENQNTGSNERREDPHREQLKSALPRNLEKKRSALEKNISFSVLQQYFSGSLRDAAKSIGVCPTTLKRICRQHGILRWPSRKIKKVNRSLQKIQTVIKSVHGVEGALKYDPATGCLVAAVSSSEEPTIITSDSVGRDIMATSSHHPEIKKLVGKVEQDDCCVDRHQIKASGHLGSFESQFTSISSAPMAAVDEINAKIYANIALAEHSHPSSSMTDSSSSSALSSPSFRKSSKSKACVAEGDSTVTVKATYKDDTVRFKILPSSGCNQLFEEIGKRFKLPIGTFQLKYMDDEEDWVLLASDPDWQECIDVLGSMGSHNVKLLVQDVLCAIGSSASSNCLLMEEP